LKITQGTPQAMELLKLFKKKECLADVYSQEFFDKQPTHDENPDAPFYKDGMESINELEDDKSGNFKPNNHLLFIFLEERDKDLMDRLLKVYPPLIKRFEGFHKPDFLILNLYTKQMLCIGFGRKNRLFAYDPVYEPAIDLYGYTGMGDGGKYIAKFTEHDYYDAVSDLAGALADLSEAMFEWDHLPHNEDMLGYALDEGPRDDGLYYIDEDDDEGYTKEEMEDFLEQFADCQSRGDAALKIIHAFFPQCEWGELNTGDY
jgi:hypothetical protein